MSEEVETNICEALLAPRVGRAGPLPDLDDGERHRIGAVDQVARSRD